MRATTRVTLTVLTACMAAIVIGGVWFFQSQKQHLQARAENELATITQLKADQIAKWRAERLSDAAVVAEDSFLVQGALRYLDDPSPATRKPLIDRFTSLKRNYRLYDVLLVDATGKPVLSLTGRLEAAGEPEHRTIFQSSNLEKLQIGPLHEGPTDLPAHIDMIAPIWATQRNDRSLIGAVVLQCDARQVLFPLIQSWPLNTETAETLLVRRDADDVLFLNELRHQKDTALKLRIPMSQKDLPAVMAVQGQTGLVTGKDYRGVEVLAVLAPIPGSDWFMVAKVDSSEVLAVWRTRAALILGAIIGLLFIALAGMVLIWQRDAKNRLEAHLGAEAAKHESEKRYQELFERATVGIFKTTSDGKVLAVNPAMAEMLGFDSPDQAQEHYTDLDKQLYTEPEQRADFIRQMKESGEVRDFEYRALSRDGRAITLSMNARIAERLEDGRFTIEGFTADITARIAAEAERKALEDQLRVAQRMEAIGQLAGGVAHDFNNLLSVIMSYTTFSLEALREGDPVRADLLEVHRAAKQAASLTRQLLAFSRRQVLEPVVLNFNDVITDLEKMLDRLIGEDVEFAVVTDADLGNTEVDRGQLEQVIMNLAVNARDAMPDGGKLTIETRNVSLDQDYAEEHSEVAPGEYVMLSVSDSGCGMDAATRERVFEPFFSTKGKGKGTGLGLSTVYGIVKQSGGHVWVYSEPGKGTTFKVYLPQVDAPVVDHVRSGAAEHLTGDETVLLVEDEEAVRKMAARVLAAAGYKVLSAANGGEALLACENNPEAIDLLVTDVVMPRMSGKELADRIAKIRPGLRVLYMSGYTDNAIVHHGVLDPGTQFIGKPFSAVEFTRKVREVLDEGADG